MLHTIPMHLRRMADLLKIASYTPDEIVRALEVFSGVLKDRKNFIDGGYGKTPILALSEAGLKKLSEGLTGDLRPIYNSGVAGMEIPFLTYFVTQFLVSVFAIRQRLEFYDIEGLDKKFPRIGKLDVREILDGMKGRGYESAKEFLEGHLDRYIKLFQNTSKLTDKDLALIKK